MAFLIVAKDGMKQLSCFIAKNRDQGSIFSNEIRYARLLAP